MNKDPLAATIVIIVTVVIVYACLLFAVNAQAELPRMEPLTATYTADGDCIKAYVIIDPDTQHQYIVSDHGGITPRLKGTVASQYMR